MPMELGIIMDPIKDINPKKDSSFALLLEADRRSWDLFYMEHRDLYLKDAIPWARMRKIKVMDNPRHWFHWIQELHRPLRELPVILMRQDPPITQEYLHTTQLLDRAEQAGTLIINKPQSLRDFNEKLIISWFPECSPQTLVTHSIQEAKQFLNHHEEVICKTLDGMGGKSIFRLRKGDPNTTVVLETLSQEEQCYMLIQRYLPAISEGDKRIILIDGSPIPYALARLPLPGETRANLAAGGQGIVVPLTAHDYWICDQVGSFMQAKGLILVGLDVIGDYLTEINITSPTGIREIEKNTQLNVSSLCLNYISKKINEKPHNTS